MVFLLLILVFFLSFVIFFLIYDILIDLKHHIYLKNVIYTELKSFHVTTMWPLCGREEARRQFLGDQNVDGRTNTVA